MYMAFFIVLEESQDDFRIPKALDFDHFNRHLIHPLQLSAVLGLKNKTKKKTSYKNLAYLKLQKKKSYIMFNETCYNNGILLISANNQFLKLHIHFLRKLSECIFANIIVSILIMFRKYEEIQNF